MYLKTIVRPPGETSVKKVSTVIECHTCKHYVDKDGTLMVLAELLPHGSQEVASSYPEDAKASFFLMNEAGRTIDHWTWGYKEADDRV